MKNSRKYNHRHNALLGAASHWGHSMRRIMTAPSASKRAKDLAGQIKVLQNKLYLELKSHRVDEDRVERKIVRK